MNEFKRPVKIAPLKISETMYLLKQRLHYKKMKLYGAKKIVSIS
jgi:hypothetical protein